MGCYLVFDTRIMGVGKMAGCQEQPFNLLRYNEVFENSSARSTLFSLFFCPPFESDISFGFRMCSSVMKVATTTNGGASKKLDVLFNLIFMTSNTFLQV